MATLTWDDTGKRLFEAGVSKGVLYVQDATGAYPKGVAWNGLTAVTETPAGAESNKYYADNIQYLNLISAETFGGTIEAYTSPVEFDECDGSASPTVGVSVGQQRRKTFGFSYRTELGNDLLGQDYGYKLHLVWGASAAPSEKSRSTINEQTEPLTLSWEFSTTPTKVTGLKPTAHITIDSTLVPAAKLTALETLLYGTTAATPVAKLPTPDEVVALFKTV